MKVTKSTEKCPSIPLALQAVATRVIASVSCAGGTEVCGTVTPHTQ